MKYTKNNDYTEEENMKPFRFINSYKNPRFPYNNTKLKVKHIKRPYTSRTFNVHTKNSTNIINYNDVFNLTNEKNENESFNLKKLNLDNSNDNL